MSGFDEELYDTRFSKLTILVVDDAQALISMIGDLMRSFGFGEIRSAQDGVEAFKIIKDSQIDVVLCDFHMNGLDGLGLAKLIRTDAESPNHEMPIIMMTGQADRAMIFGARDAGVNEFIVKPFASKDLFVKVAAIVENPRKFISVEDFVGPDRRRRAKNGFEGGERRKA